MKIQGVSVERTQSMVWFWIILDALKYFFLFVFPLLTVAAVYTALSPEEQHTGFNRSSVDENGETTFHFFSSNANAIRIRKEQYYSQLETTASDKEAEIKSKASKDSTVLAKLFPIKKSGKTFSKSNDASLTASNHWTPIDKNPSYSLVDGANTIEPVAAMLPFAANIPFDEGFLHSAEDKSNTEGQKRAVRVKRGNDDEVFLVGAWEHNILDNIDDTKHFHFYESRINPDGAVPDSKEDS